VTYFFVSGLWHLFVFTQEAGDCDFFKWADNHMTSYEKRLEEHMRDMEEGRRADIEKVEKMTMTNIDRLEKLIETKHNEQYARLRLELGLRQSNRKMFWVAVVVIILGLVIYLSGYSGSEVSYLMLEWIVGNKKVENDPCQIFYVLSSWTIEILNFSYDGSWSVKSALD
jgi:hypothetical protein